MVDIETGYKGVRRGGVYFLEMRHIVLYFREQFLPMRFNVNVPDTQKKRQQSKRKKRSMTHHERHRLFSNGKRFWQQSRDKSMSVSLSDTDKMVDFLLYVRFIYCQLDCIPRWRKSCLEFVEAMHRR